jgi:hypothetical protein
MRCTNGGVGERVSVTREGDALVVRRGAGAAPANEALRVVLPASAALRVREVDGG